MLFSTGPKDPDSTPDTPKRVFLPRVDSAHCRNLLNKKIYDNQICAGGEIGQDTCTEDSGYPLLRHNNGSVYAEGIVSQGLPQCGEKPIPGIYIYIPKFIDWIKYNIRV